MQRVDSCRKLAAAALIVLISPLSLFALPHLRRPIRHASSATTRKRLHINGLIAEPGTVELDWGNLYSYTTGNFTMPSALKYTPAGNGILIGRTEYSVAFDSVSSAQSVGARTTQFSDRITMTATSVLFDSTHFDVALAPQTTVFLRDESGVRYGATVIAREDIGGNSMGLAVSWSGATTSSTNNPAGTWDISGGFGRPLSAKGLFNRFTPHVNYGWERSTGFDGALSAFAGIEYQATRRIAFDVTGQRVGLSAGGDRQILVGMTLNFGKLLSGQ